MWSTKSRNKIKNMVSFKQATTQSKISNKRFEACFPMILCSYDPVIRSYDPMRLINKQAEEDGVVDFGAKQS